MKRTITRYALCITGILLTSLSTAVFYLLRLGSDPIQVLFSGIANTLQISYGMVITVFNLTAGVFIFLFARRYVRAALFFSVLCAGVFVDLYLMLLSPWLAADLSQPVKTALGILGCVVMCLGIYVYLLPDLGASPTEGIGLIIAEKLKVEYGLVRIALDILFTVLGWALGGNFGVITVFAMLTTGPGVAALERMFKRKIVKS